MEEIQAAQVRLLKKREEQKATEPSIRSTTNISETLEELISKARKAADKYGETQDVSFVNDKGYTTYHVVEPTAVKLERRGIPKRYHESTFDAFKGNDKLVETLISMGKGTDDILLFGQTGCGKTHLAVAFLLSAGSGYFTTAPELLLRIRSTFNENNSETEEHVINELSRHDLLVIDDLGAEKTSEYAITTLYIIIDRRIRDAKRTIITTNLTLKEIEDKLDARIASRLSGMQNIKINMPDYRKKRG